MKHSRKYVATYAWFLQVDLCPVHWVVLYCYLLKQALSFIYLSNKNSNGEFPKGKQLAWKHWRKDAGGHMDNWASFPFTIMHTYYFTCEGQRTHLQPRSGLWAIFSYYVCFHQTFKYAEVKLLMFVRVFAHLLCIFLDSMWALHL